MRIHRVLPVLAALAVLTLLLLRSAPWTARAATRVSEFERLSDDRPRDTDLAPRAGDCLRYRFTSTRDLALEAVFGLDLGEERIDLPALRTSWTLDGELEADVLADAQGWTLAFRATAVRAKVTSGAPAPPMARDPMDLMRGDVLVRLERSGRISAILLPDGMTGAGRALWKEVLARWQFVLEEGERWDADEEDPTGSYRARYERTSPAGAMPIEVRKHKLLYTSLNRTGEGAGPAATHEAEGETCYVLDPLPLRIEGREQLRIVAERTITAEIRFAYERIACERRALRAAPASWRGATTLAEVERDGAPADPAATERQAREHLVTMDRLVALGQHDSIEMHNAVVGLVHALRDSPAAVGPVAESLRARPDLAPELCTSLGAAGTPEAQAALVAYARQARGAERRQALIGMVMAEAPVPEADAVILESLDEEPQALLALAAVGFRVKSTDPARFESIRRAIEQRLKTAQGDGDLVQALEAIGNLGPADVPERVREACTDEREHVRIAAVHALLRVDDANADRQLKKAAYTDASPAVRAEALETVVRRHASGFGNEGGLGGTVADFLNEFASIEPTPELKRRAEEMLGAVRS